MTRGQGMNLRANRSRTNGQLLTRLSVQLESTPSGVGLRVVGKCSWKNRVVGKFLVGKIDSKLERTV